MPAHLNHFAILDQNRNRTLTVSQQTLASRWVLLDVIFDEFRTLPLEPLPHLLRVRTTRRSEQFKRGHGGAPQAIRE